MPKGQTLTKTETKTVTLTITKEASEVVDDEGNFRYTDMDINIDIPGVGVALFSVTSSPIAFEQGHVIEASGELVTQFWGMQPADVLEL